MSSSTEAPIPNYELPAAAADGFANASAYDAYRPSYPSAAVDALLGHLRIADVPHANIVEIAAGTGKFTELLAARHERFVIAAIEPHAGMRARLEEKKLPGVTVRDGHAAKMPLESEWGDACIAAQSFHWFATEDTLEEVRRVLKPNAVFGMIWNIEDYNKPRSWKATTSWEKKLNDWIHSISTDGHPRFRDEVWQDVFQKQLTSNLLQIMKDSFTDNLPKFSLPLGEDSVSWTVWLSEDALWDRLSTLSQVAILEGDQREAARRVLKDALQMEDVERNDKGDVALHGVTYLSWTSKV